MNALAVILVVAAVGYGISRWLRLPVIPLLLFAGIGLSFLGLLPEGEFTMDAFVLGLAFLMFTAGMELNPKRFRRQLKAVLWVGLIQFVVVAGVGFFAASLLDFDAITCIYLAVALSTSSTLVVVNHLKRQHQMFEPFGRLVIGVLLIQDLLMILIIVILSQWPEGALAVIKGLAGAFMLGALAVACQRWLMPFLIVKMRLDEESLLLAVLALLFAFSGLAFNLDLPPVAGAFLAGFALANFPVNGVVRGLLLSLSDFFQAIFFTTVGALVIWPDWIVLAQAATLALLVLLLTPPLVAMVAEWTGLNSRAAVESGLLLAQTSEFALVLGLTGSQTLQQISPEVLSIIALVTVATMTLTPFIATDRFTTFLLQFHPLRRRLKHEGLHRGHILMLGFGTGGMWVIKPLRQEGHDVLVVDDDPVVIEQLQKLNVPCLRGDGSDDKILARAGAAQAKLILASMRRVSEAERVIQHVRGVPVVVRVFEDFDARHVRELGGIPILNSEASTDTFMEWFEKTFPRKATSTAEARG